MYLLKHPGIELTIDIAALHASNCPTAAGLPFEMDGFARTCLLQGVDQLGYLLKQPPPSTPSKQSREARHESEHRLAAR